MLNHSPNSIYLAFTFIAVILCSQVCTQEQMSKTGIMRREATKIDLFSIAVGVQLGKVGAAFSTTQNDGVAPTIVTDQCFPQPTKTALPAQHPGQSGRMSIKENV